jgi:hypothetical protein
MGHKSKYSSPGDWTAKVKRESNALDLEQEYLPGKTQGKLPNY